MLGVGEVAQTMYTHVSKCKNDKNLKKNKRNSLSWDPMKVSEELP
jgi:hypothetical protein